MTKDELIELAQVGMGIHSPNQPEYIVCEALIKALAQPEQEQWVCECGADSYLSCKCAIKFPPQRKEPEQERFLVATIGNWGRVEWADGVIPSIGDKMYSAPPKWVGLTGHEQKELMAMSARDAVFATEAKLKEKNT